MYNVAYAVCRFARRRRRDRRRQPRSVAISCGWGRTRIAAAHARTCATYYVHAKDTRIDPRHVGRQRRARHNARQRLLGTVSWNYITLGPRPRCCRWRAIRRRTRRCNGYDDVLSIEHEDPAMSPEEGVEKSVDAPAHVCLSTRPRARNTPHDVRFRVASARRRVRSRGRAARLGSASPVSQAVRGRRAAMEAFLAEVCTPEWNVRQDAGRPFAEAVAELSRSTRQDAPHPGVARALRRDDPRRARRDGRDCGGAQARGVPLYALTNWSAETFPASAPASRSSPGSTASWSPAPKA